MRALAPKPEVAFLDSPSEPGHFATKMLSLEIFQREMRR